MGYGLVPWRVVFLIGMWFSDTSLELVPGMRGCTVLLCISTSNLADADKKVTVKSILSLNLLGKDGAMRQGEERNNL